MNSFLIELYKKFLYAKVTKSEFGEMRFDMNKISNDELSEFERNEWNDFVINEKMPLEKKGQIEENLKFFAGQNLQNEKSNKIWLKIAAVFLPLLLLGSIYMYTFQQANLSNCFVVDVAKGNKATITLPDNSKAWINSYSRLQYLSSDKKNRSVVMHGEVFFQVEKSKTKPFVISFENLKIQVLGTSFNVKAYDNSETIETSLVEGSLKISGDHFSQEFVLKPNEKAIYNKKTNNLTIVHTNNEAETAWKDNKLVFDTERFGDVIVKLENWYGITITNHYPQIENDLITGSFNNQGIESVMDILKVQYSINYTRKGDTIAIFPIK